ncbi:hypothetical protein [Streptomyces cyanogenus]|uniref:hypothetical protein n=1 Tax=Streptomyces cyanogenus TaxID=80860 RepID=UPI001AA17297|nr:hypothetical protein [Streptomyces cyanogenus]
MRAAPYNAPAFPTGEVSPQLVRRGTSEVLLWSSATVGGIPVVDLPGQGGCSVEDIRKEVERDIRFANITIIEVTGASQYGIGAVSARLVEAVLREERAVLPVAAYSSRRTADARACHDAGRASGPGRECRDPARSR